MHRFVLPSATVSILFSGAIFGFFFAWICSTMWGLDTLAPNAAIDAMNAMNISVRNAVFMPAFFLTPVVLAVSAAVSWAARARWSAGLFATGAAVYVAGAFVPTALINVPMNDALKLVETPLDPAQAQAIWDAYSPKWQFANIARTIVAGVTLTLAIFALHLAARRTA